MEKKFLHLKQGVNNKFPLYVKIDERQINTILHSHDFEELVIIYQGSGVHNLNNNRTPVEVGDVFLIPRGSNHGYENCSPDFRLFNILFIPELLILPQLDEIQLPIFREIYQGKSQEMNIFPHFHLNKEEFDFASHIAMELVYESQNRQVGYQFNMYGLFITLLGKLMRSYSNQQVKHTYHSLGITQAIAYLNTHYKEDIPIAKLCEISHMSKASLMRNFFQHSGSSPRQYQIHLRISDATMLLKVTQHTIAEIAFEVGFKDCNYFCRQFKKITKLTPNNYRKKM